MARAKLKLEERKILGKKVKKLRREGILPTNVYGKDMKSKSAQVPLADFLKVYKEEGETGLIDVEIGKEAIPVLIHNVQTNYKHEPLHADFFKVNLKEKVKTMVPIELTGEPRAVVDKVGLLMAILNDLEVEALPTDLPEKIEVDVASLANVDEQITVADLKLPTGVETLTDPNQVVAKIGELVSKEAQALAAEEALAAEAAAAESAAEEGEIPAEGAEGEAAPTEGEVPTEAQGEKKPEEQPSTEQKPQKA